REWAICRRGGRAGKLYTWSRQIERAANEGCLYLSEFAVRKLPSCVSPHAFVQLPPAGIEIEVSVPRRSNPAQSFLMIRPRRCPVCWLTGSDLLSCVPNPATGSLERRQEKRKEGHVGAESRLRAASWPPTTSET